MGRIRKDVARKGALPEVDPKIQKERQRIAEHLVRALREASYECSLLSPHSDRGADMPGCPFRPGADIARLMP